MDHQVSCQLRHDPFVSVRVGEASHPGPPSLLEGLQSILESCEEDYGDAAEQWLLSELRTLVSARPSNLLQELKSLVKRASRAPQDFAQTDHSAAVARPRGSCSEAWAEGQAGWHSTWEDDWWTPSHDDCSGYAWEPHASPWRRGTTHRTVLYADEWSAPAASTTTQCKGDQAPQSALAGKWKNRKAARKSRNVEPSLEATSRGEGKSASSQDEWQITKEFWVAAAPQAVGWTDCPADLAEELDVSDGVAWCFLTQCPEEAEEAADLITAAEGDETSHSLTIMFDGHADALGDWASGARLTAVPGKIGARLVMRKLWVISFGASAATLSTKESKPLQITSRPPKPDVQRASSVVVRFVFEQHYNLNWDKLAKKPSHFARLWASGFGLTQGSILDSWGWQLEGDSRVRGLLRVDTATAARSLWENSGAIAGGCCAFTNILGEFQEKERQEYRVQWIPWTMQERYSDYLRRVQGLAKHGIVSGRSLGIRLTVDDPSLKESPCLWRAKAVPAHWQLEHVAALMHDVGFRDVQVQAKHRSKRGADWLFKAVRRDGSSVVQRDLYWDPDDADVSELIVIKEGARRARKVATRDIPASYAVDFTDLVKSASASKKLPKPSGKGAARRRGNAIVDDGPAGDAGQEPDEESRERQGPGLKRRAEESEADVDQEGEPTDAATVWKLNATLKDNPGAGNCLYHALGISGGSAGKEYNHRQVRRWVNHNLLYFEADFKEMWTNGGQFNCSGRTSACSWKEFLQEQTQNASWGGSLEIAAYARGADVRIWIVVAGEGAVHLINPTGAKGALALHFDPQRQHYQCYVDFVEQHLEERYKELGGKCLPPDQLLRGGSPVAIENSCQAAQVSCKLTQPPQPAKRRFLTLSECASERSVEDLSLGGTACPPFRSLSDCASASPVRTPAPKDVPPKVAWCTLSDCASEHAVGAHGQSAPAAGVPVNSSKHAMTRPLTLSECASERSAVGHPSGLPVRTLSDFASASSAWTQVLNDGLPGAAFGTLSDCASARSVCDRTGQGLEILPAPLEGPAAEAAQVCWCDEQHHIYRRLCDLFFDADLLLHSHMFVQLVQEIAAEVGLAVAQLEPVADLLNQELDTLCRDPDLCSWTPAQIADIRCALDSLRAGLTQDLCEASVQDTRSGRRRLVGKQPLFRGLSDFASASGVSSDPVGVKAATRAWPTRADLRMLQHGEGSASVALPCDRITVKPSRRRLRCKTRPWTNLAGVVGTEARTSVPGDIRELEPDLEPEPPCKRLRRNAIPAEPKRWECPAPGCSFVVVGSQSKISKARWNHNQTAHNGCFHVGAQRFEDTILTPRSPEELADGQSLGWVCPCCPKGFLSDEWTHATGEQRTASCRKHRLEEHREVALTHWYALIRLRGNRLASARAIKRGKALNRAAEGSAIAGCTTFLWPQWSPQRSGICVLRAWRCNTCMHCFLHRGDAVKHQCTGTAPIKSRNPIVLTRRLQALDALTEHAADSALQQHDFRIIVNRCRCALRGGGSYCQPIFDALCHHQLDACALQEVDLNLENSLSFARFWRSQGWHAVIAPSDDGKARAAVVSRLPLTSLQLASCSSRVAAALTEVRSGGTFFKLLLVSFYGKAGDAEVTRELLAKAREDLAPFGLPFVLAGDFQFATTEYPIATALAQGLLVDLDDCRAEPPPPTGPGNTRVIDYALACPSLCASSACTFTGIADHSGVYYDFEDLGASPPLRPPTFRVVRHTREEVQAAFLTSAFQAQWGAAVSVDQQWEVLASFADHALTDCDPSASIRHLPWDPKCRTGGQHKAATASEPVDVRRLRRFLRRLQQAGSHGCTATLGRAIRRDIAQLTEVFPSLSQVLASSDDFSDAAAAVTQILQDRVEALRSMRIKAWKTATKEDPSKQRRWIKERAELLLARTAKGLSPEGAAQASLLPEAVLEQEGRQWTRLWTASPQLQSHVRQVSSLLAALPALSEEPTDFDLSPEALRCSMGKMAGKSGGADGLQAAQLLHLPPLWWASFSQLWMNVLSTGSIPLVWKRISVVLLPKLTGGYRPIALACVAWRCGARCLMAGLRDWCDRWAGASSFGGLPTRSTADVHKRVHCALLRGTKVAVQEDLRRFFDSVHFTLADQVLARWGMPLAVRRVLAAFYDKQERLLMVRGRCASTWFQATCGLIQGCPLSPVVAAAVMQVWASVVEGPSVLALTFQDDRTMLAVGGPVSAQCEELRAAGLRSKTFDTAFALACDPGKSSVVGGPDAQGLADTLGYARVEALSLLGVSHPLDCTLPKQFQRLFWERVHARLQYTGLVSHSTRQVLLHLQSLCFAPFLWAAGFVQPSDNEFAALNEPVKGALRLALTREAPPVLFHEIFEWRSSARFCADWAVLRTAVAAFCVRRSWHENLLLDELVTPWQFSLPQAAPLLAKLGWTVARDGSAIHRVDASGRQRSFCLGYDGLHVLREWLLLYHRRKTLARCGRTRQAFHRSEAGLARGLDLPGPQPHAFIRALGPRALWSSANDLEDRRAAMATGGTCWYYGAMHALDDKEHAVCTCGLTAPSRAHRSWVCADTADLRHGIPMPLNRAQERLMARESVEEPPAPVLVAPDELVAEVAEDLCLGESTLIAATDGSSKHSVGAAAFTLPGQRVKVASGLPGEDQSPYKAELHALLLLFRVFCAVPSEQRTAVKVLHVFSDCQSALTAIRTGKGALPLLVRDVAMLCADIARSGVEVQLHWVPSHGKPAPSWVPWPGAHPDLQRQWNAEVDALAAAECHRRLHGSQREAFARHLEEIQNWERRVLRASAEASRRLSKALQGVG
ncbi:gcs-1 [Symbiodinium sp. CCMP2592]|nr:gcs-1 [Symbiodinium sp. CCMP2592]